MTLTEVREYFQKFKCEVLTSSENNKNEIKGFSSKIRDNTLEGYLKDEAWKHDADGITRVYLVRDSTNEIVLYFSLKCGVVFTTNSLDDSYRSLNSAEKKFVQNLVEAKINRNTDLVYNYIALSKVSFPDNYGLLVQIAEHRFQSKNESYEVGDVHYVMKVDACYAAIELQHFCKRDDYRVSPDIGIPLGFGLFWEKIVPIIEEITAKVGCEYLYLFAADRSENPEDKKLISYYKSALSFMELEDEGVIVLKPGYDDNCVGLLQKTKYLSDTREYAWESFSDHVTT